MKIEIDLVRDAGCGSNVTKLRSLQVLYDIKINFAQDLLSLLRHSVFELLQE